MILTPVIKATAKSIPSHGIRLQDQVLNGGEDRIPRLYKIFREIRRDVGNTDFNLIRAYEAQSGSIESVAFSTDGSQFATGCSGGEARIYNVADGQRIASHARRCCRGLSQSHSILMAHNSLQAGFDGKIRIFRHHFRETTQCLYVCADRTCR